MQDATSNLTCTRALSLPRQRFTKGELSGRFSLFGAALLTHLIGAFCAEGAVLAKRITLGWYLWSSFIDLTMAISRRDKE